MWQCHLSDIHGHPSYKRLIIDSECFERFCCNKQTKLTDSQSESVPDSDRQRSSLSKWLVGTELNFGGVKPFPCPLLVRFLSRTVELASSSESLLLSLVDEELSLISPISSGVIWKVGGFSVCTVEVKRCWLGTGKWGSAKSSIPIIGKLAAALEWLLRNELSTISNYRKRKYLLIIEVP